MEMRSKHNPMHNVAIVAFVFLGILNDIEYIPCFFTFFTNSGCISPFKAINVKTSESSQFRLLSSSSSLISFNLGFFCVFLGGGGEIIWTSSSDLFLSWSGD